MARQRIGPYEILERIGTGGQATVYRVRDIRLDRIVALKIPKPELADDPNYIKILYDDARLAARVQHPNVVVIHEVDHEEDVHFIAMEYLPSSLRRLLREALSELCDT